MNEIADGPNRAMLFKGFSAREEIEFITPSGRTIPVLIFRIGYEDKTGNSFLLEGSFYPSNSAESPWVRGCYNCSTRRGWIRTIQPFER